MTDSHLPHSLGLPDTHGSRPFVKDGELSRAKKRRARCVRPLRWRGRRTFVRNGLLYMLLGMVCTALSTGRSLKKRWIREQRWVLLLSLPTRLGSTAATLLFVPTKIVAFALDGPRPRISFPGFTKRTLFGAFLYRASQGKCGGRTSAVMQ